MVVTARIALTVLLCFYLLALVAWQCLHLIYGDQLWWLALISSFAPLFFAPLLFFLPLALFVRWWSYSSGLALATLLFLDQYGALFLPKSPPPYQIDAPTITAMTFNMLAASRQAETAQVIAENGYPDVVALQETTVRIERLVRDVVGDRYPYIFFEYTADGRGMATLSRYPLTPVRVDLLIDLNCRVFRATVNPTHHFMLYNCRPRSSNVDRFFNDGVPLAGQVAETFQIRTLLSERLVTQIAASNEPTILIGDFNTTEQSASYQILRRSLLDAHRQIGWGFGHTYPAGPLAWNGLPVPGRLLRIDMVWYTADFVALNTYVSPFYGESDHRPVVAQLAWRAD